MVSVDGDFGGAVVHQVDVRVQGGKLSILFGFGGEFDKGNQPVDMLGELVHCQFMDFHEGVVNVSVSYMWKSGSCCSGLLFKPLHV